MKKMLAILLTTVSIFLSVCILPTSASAASYSLATPKITSVTEGHNCNIITWKKVKNAAKYRVFVKSGSNWKSLGTTSSTSFKAKVNGKVDSYNRYTVRCVSANGKTFTSNFDHNGYYCHHRKAPTFTSAYRYSNEKAIKFSWTKVNMPSSGKYRVFIRTASGSWKKLTDVPAGVTTCKLKESTFRKKEYRYVINLERGWTTVYQITVRAVDRNGKYISDFADDLSDLCLWSINLAHISERINLYL